jgi:hypothetical protein
MLLQDTLINNFGYNLPDGIHPVLPEYVDSEFREAYEGLVETTGNLSFLIKDGTVEKAYKASLGVFNKEVVLRNNFVDYPITGDPILVPTAFVYVNTSDRPDDSQLMAEINTADLLELRPAGEGGGSNGLLKVKSGDIPDGVYFIKERKLCTAQDKYGSRQFTAVTLIAEKEVKVLGTRWNVEEKCNDVCPKEPVLEFTSALPATYGRASVEYVTMSGFNKSKPGEARPIVGCRPEARFRDKSVPF